jgi:hypothetical protein
VKSSRLFFILCIVFLSGCNNASVSVANLTSLLGIQKTPAGYNIGAGQSQMTNNGFVIKAKVLGFGSGNIINGSFITHVEVTP